MSANKVVLVTGGGTGIGYACADSFMGKGYDAVITGRRKDVIDKAKDELAAKHPSQKIIALNCDVSKREDVDKIFDEIEKEFGRIDAVVNNAGIAPSHPFLETSYEEYDRALKTNQYGTFMCMQKGAQMMVDKKIEGSIINMGSIYGIFANAKTIGYNASKGAVDMMTKTAALELAPYNIRVNAIAPGVIDTPMLEIDKQRGTFEELYSKGIRKKPLPPKVIGDVAAFLASDEADGINGLLLPVDDGFIAYK